MQTGAKQEIDGKEADGSHQTGQEHAPRGGDADEDAIPDKRGCASHGDEHRPRQIGSGSGHHLTVGREQTEESGASQPVGHGEEHGHASAPGKEMPHRMVQLTQVGGTVAFSRQGFAGKGQPVHHITEQGEQLHEQRVGSQNLRPLHRSSRGEVEVDGDKADRAQEDFKIDPAIGKEREVGSEQPGTELQSPTVAGLQLVAAQDAHQRKAEPGPLGNERAQGHALHPKMADQHKQQRGQDVHHVLPYGNKHGQARVLHTDEPARQGIQPQHSRRAPYARIIIGCTQCAHVGRGLHQPEREQLERHLQRHNDGAEQERRQQAAVQNVEGGGVAGSTALSGLPAESLGCKPARAHAQKTEKPVHHIENHRPHGNGANVGGTAHVAHNGHVAKPQQRHRDVRHDAGQGQSPYFAVNRLHLHLPDLVVQR